MGNMALINCRECGHQVSTKAQQCPSCGAVIKGSSPVKKGLGVIAALGFGFAAAIVAMTVFVMNDLDSAGVAGVVAFAVGAVVGWYRVVK